MTSTTPASQTPDETESKPEATANPAAEEVSEPARELCAGDVMATHLLTVDASDGLLLTWELVSQAEVHHIPVIEHGRCLGLVAERDLALEVARNPLGQTRRLVRELTDGSPAYVQAETTVPHVAAMLLRTGKDAVLVHTPQGQLIGLVTVHDLLRALAGQVTPREPGQDWDYSPALFRLMPVLPGPMPTSTGQ